MLYYIVASAKKQIRTSIFGFLFSLTIDKPSFDEALHSVNESARLKGWSEVCATSVVNLSDLKKGRYFVAFKIKAYVDAVTINLENGKALQISEDDGSVIWFDQSGGHRVLPINSINPKDIIPALENFVQGQIPVGYECMITNLIKVA